MNHLFDLFGDVLAGHRHVLCPSRMHLVIEGEPCTQCVES